MSVDEPVDRAALVLTARDSVRAHADGRRCCVECPGEGCRQHAWAVTVVDEDGRPVA